MTDKSFEPFDCEILACRVVDGGLHTAIVTLQMRVRDDDIRLLRVPTRTGPCRLMQVPVAQAETERIA